MQKTRDILIRTAEGVMSLLVVFLMLAGTVVCSGKLLGVDFFAKPEPTNRDLLPPPDVLREMEVFDFTIEAAGTGLWQLTSRRGEPVGMLVCSLPYAEDVTGFSGPTPVWVYIDGGGRVRSIVPMDNAESARFFGRAIDGGILSRWIGAPAVAADSVSLDAVTGATYSSNALTANVEAACAAYAGATGSVKAAPAIGWGRTAAVAAVLAVGLYASFCRKGSRRWRLAQLVLNVGVTGFWCGQFLSVTLLRGWIESGWNLVASLPAVLMLAVAVVLPLLGRRRYYCMWVCPYGSLQALAYRLPTPKLRVGPRAMRWMGRLRFGVLMALLAAMWAGYGAWLLDYEPFTAFFVTAAVPAVAVLATAFVVLAVFVPSPWCRAVCPMGELLHLAEPSNNEKL